MKEEVLSREVIIPLLKAMGYRDVYEHHGGSGEQGKDIVYWKEEESGKRHNVAIVAKAVPLTGQAKGKGSSGEVAMQVNQCFGEPFLDPMTGEPQDVHECWVVTNKKIPKEALKATQSGILPLYRRFVIFINGDKLWEYVEKYLLVSFYQAIEKAMKEAAEADPHYFPQVTITREGTHITLQEKYPGASKDKPITITGKFEFPKNPEGQAIKDALDAHLRTGSPVEIPGSYIKDIEMPDFIKRIIGINVLNLELLSFSTPEAIKNLPVKIQVEGNNNFSIDYVDLKLKQAGREEVTFNNKHQVTPFLVTIIFMPQTANLRFNIRIKDGPFNALQIKDIAQFYNCFTGSSRVIVIPIETGIPLFEERITNKRNKPLARSYMQMISVLAAIQVSVRRPIIIPERNFTHDEAITISKLRTILHEGKIEGTWNNLKMELSRTELPAIIKVFKEGDDVRFRGESEEVVELFGTEIPLGRLSQTFYDPYIEDLDELERAIAILPDNIDPLQITLRPRSNNLVVSEYLDWKVDSVIDQTE
jgi:hypothetical protein